MVTDFGIARAISEGDSRLTATGIAIGTPTYMSPEQAAGERTIDGRSDLYSLGILGYQMLTGEPPFIANSTPAILVKHISERPTPVEQRRSDVPPDLAAVIMTLLEKDPAHRIPAAADVVRALDSGRMPTFERPAFPAPAPVDGTIAARTSRPLATPPTGDLYVNAGPTPEEYRRWNAEPVVKFRRKLAPYLFVNGVIVVASILGESNFFGLTVLWSIYLAFKYAKLWADGYDWRDVFRQPRDRDLIDVVEDFFGYLRGMLNREQRQMMRQQRREQAIARRSGGVMQPALPASGMSLSGDLAQAAGIYGDRVRKAETDRAEILRLLDRMPSSDRSRIPDVGRSADALADKVKYLAVAMADLERSMTAGGAEAIEAEISRLEGAANPLDAAGSEERVRRLAKLKRDRRAVADLAGRRDALAAKLETCSVALQNIKLDLIRLNAGSQTPQHITSLAIDALNLADSVDSALYVSDEMRNTSSRAASRPAAR
jgi:serine/threonine-protein kinase